MSRTLLARTAPLLLLLAGTPVLAQTTVFTDDFQGGNIKPQWSANTTVNTANEGVFSWYNGRYSSQAIHLNLPAAPAAPSGQFNRYTLRFDLLALDSWDGNNPEFGPDSFRVAANGATVFNETFSNWDSNQTYGAPTVGPTLLGADPRWPDSIYRGVTVAFTPGNGQAIDLKFWSTANQGLNDESWGIDNVSVSYSVVPAPAAFAVPAVAGLAGLRRRRA